MVLGRYGTFEPKIAIVSMTTPSDTSPQEAETPSSGRAARLKGIFSGDALAARAMRGSALTVIQFGGANALRLGSNLILTRILFPEAFGLMALTQVFLIGLQMFSQLGINASVVRSPRGDDPAFLNTAWTVQIIRGVLLWLICLAAAYPVATIVYNEPQLAQLLPVVGLTAIIQGFASIKLITANRKLLLGRVTAIELGSQALGIVAMIIGALILKSVWALVIGGLIGALAKTLLSHSHLPGERARLQFEKSAFWELFHFGKWLFLGTIAGFLMKHGDRAILGRYIELDALAFYQIAFMLATLNLALNTALVSKILYPLYCSVLTTDASAKDFKIARARLLLTGGTFAVGIPFIFFGREIIELLYDPRYHLAGPMVVGIAFAWLFQLITAGYSPVLLAVGRSRAFALVLVFSAVVRTALMVIGARDYGIPGVIGATLLAELIIYPVLIRTVHKHRIWNPFQDFGFAALAVALVTAAIWVDPTVWSDFVALVP